MSHRLVPACALKRPCCASADALCRPSTLALSPQRSKASRWKTPFASWVATATWWSSAIMKPAAPRGRNSVARAGHQRRRRRRRPASHAGAADLYTIYRDRPLDGLSIAFIGELDRGRTVRSLAYLLAKFDRVKIYFVSPPELQMRPDILQYLERHGVRYEVESQIDRALGQVDVVYQTRIRPQRVAGLTGRYASPSIRRCCGRCARTQ